MFMYICCMTITIYKKKRLLKQCEPVQSISVPNLYKAAVETVLLWKFWTSCFTFSVNETVAPLILLYSYCELTDSRTLGVENRVKHTHTHTSCASLLPVSSKNSLHASSSYLWLLCTLPCAVGVSWSAYRVKTGDTLWKGHTHNHI